MFSDRRDAGRRLAALLRDRPLTQPLVLAIPRGGVVVGAEIARALDAELDVILVASLHAPDQPEFVLGAVSEEGEMYLNPSAEDYLAGDDGTFHQQRARELDRLQGLSQVYRDRRPRVDEAGRSVIVVDDGISTGTTMIAVLQLLKQREPYEVIVAVPAGPADRLEEIRGRCDDVICLITSQGFGGVGQFYKDFSPVEDEIVVTLHREARGRQADRQSHSSDEETRF